MSSEIFNIITNRYRYNFKYRIRKFLYYGKNYYCPCCERYIRKFAPFGKPKRLNAECPFCYVMERHRIYFLFLKNKTNFFKAKLKVLDFGPEYYLQIIFKKLSNLNYISADLNPDNAMLVMDVTDIKFEDNFFDFIICIGVIEHVIDDKKALNELFRVLKPGGKALIIVPINYDNKSTIELYRNNVKKHDKDKHARDYGIDFFDLLKKSGFEVRFYRFKDQLNQDKIRLFGLMNCEEQIYFCFKPENQDNPKFKIFD